MTACVGLEVRLEAEPPPGTCPSSVFPHPRNPSSAAWRIGSTYAGPPGIVAAGPRTLQQLDGHLAAASTGLSDGVLDRTDAIVEPGVTLDLADTLWAHGTRALDAAQRRR